MASSNAATWEQATTEQDVCRVPSTQADLFTVRAPDRGTIAWEILSAMQNGAKLTPLLALQRFNCLSLSQRVGELKRSGWPILSKMISLPSGKRCAEYSMDIELRGERDDYPLREASFRG